YPEDIELKDYREYHIREQHPDVIYTQNAYDRYNYSYVLPEEYYTSELAKYTEELVYVPGFCIGSCDPEDAKLYKTADYFVKIPGLLHADRIILESEEVRQFYIQNLLEFCGGDTRDLWEKKLEVSQDPCCMEDKKYSEQEAGGLAEWCKLLYDKNGKKRRIILYQNTISSFARQPERMLEKLRRVLEVFYDNRADIALIWRPHVNMFAAMELLDREIWLEYRRIVDEFRMAGWGILDETWDATLAERLADAYYGDPDLAVLHFGNNGKPVMILSKNVD
ncbi:MAG: hypothetical protein K6B69_09765, partial [Lachnospiraceae bacterium]|nr:hypothetical protein [Lachnospiraceae bacterium]